MKASKAVALSAAALVLGLVVGNVAVGFAAPATATVEGSGLGIRMGTAMRDAGGRLADVVAKLTGADVADVVEQRQAGTSFATIADKAGVSAGTVVSETLKVRQQVLASRVAAGQMTQAQADAALNRMETRLTDRVSATDGSCTGTGGGCGGGGMGVGRGQGGQGGAGCGAGGAGGCGGGGCTQSTTVTQ